MRSKMWRVRVGMQWKKRGKKRAGKNRRYKKRRWRKGWARKKRLSGSGGNALDGVCLLHRLSLVLA
jgi:hypothetical protein